MGHGPSTVASDWRPAGVDHGGPGGNAAWWTRLPRLPERLIDVLIAVGMGTLVASTAAIATEIDAVRSLVAAVGLGVSLGVLLLFRRRWPVTILLLSVVAVAAYHAANFAAIGSLWPLTVALYTCAARGRTRVAIVATAVLAAGAAGWRLAFEPEAAFSVLVGTLLEAAAGSLAVALGDTARSRRGWSEEIQERLRHLERDREREADQRVSEERLRIARELHDIMAHTLAVASVQLNVAADALNDTSGEAKAAMNVAQQVNREAVAELRAAVRVLRQDAAETPPRDPVPGIGDVPRLVGMARDSGLRVDYHAEAGALPAPAELAVYRIVQESLTNVMRHADATQVEVTINEEKDGVTVDVIDNGAGVDRPLEERRGHGIIGMRERVLGLGGTFAAGGGTFAAGGGPERGFAVHAWIPLEPAR